MAPRDQEKASLLSPTAYDDDAPDVGSDREPLSDDEDEDEEEDSAERAQEEQGVFEDDYEEEELGAGDDITLKRLFNRSKNDGQRTLTIKERRAQKRASRRHRERVKRGEEEAELVYDMEEGGQPSQSPSRNSSESDLRRLAAMRSETEKLKKASRLGPTICFKADKGNRRLADGPIHASSFTPLLYSSSSCYCTVPTKPPKPVDPGKQRSPQHSLFPMAHHCSLQRPFSSLSMASAPISYSEDLHQP